MLFYSKKENTKAISTLLKKNWFTGVYEKYLGILSGGYIYFYKSSEDDEYNGYYYLKDSEVESSLDSLIIFLSNETGSIELKFPNKSKSYDIYSPISSQYINDRRKTFHSKNNFKNPLFS